jgi:phenylalanyl-tRNA synthetase beta chain
MRFSYRWLRDYFQTDLSYTQVLDAATMTGLEVEEAADLGLQSGNIVFGEIVELNKHPDADRLSVCRVRIDEAEPVQIVCGASNIAVGQRVPVAKVGATLPNGITLKRTKIRGVESMGMMCSAKELEAAADADGIWIQPEDSPVGEPFDALVTIKVTPNRPDALSLLGLARDLAAKTGGRVVQPEVKFPEVADKIDSVARVTVEAREDCPRYAARVIRNVKVGPSPLWMQRRLESAGLRPINNIVDITNYVLLEMGHPLHAFDLDRVTKRHIVVRNAKAGETLRLLDERTVTLVPTDLLIADPEKPLVVAGIMGGIESGVTDDTTTVLLESAYFNPATIRRTAKRLGITTDSSYRFERGTDPKGLLKALHRAAQLMVELAGGEVLKGHIDVLGKLPTRDPITLRIDRFRALTGMSLTGREMSETLVKLGFEVPRANEAELSVNIPSFRPDIMGEADLIEEVARIVGYEKIPFAVPALPTPAEIETPQRRLATRAIDELVALGFNQAVNFSFVSHALNAVAAPTNDGRTVRVLNPLAADQEEMRRSLVPSLLANVRHNLNQGVETIRLFEVGRTYEWPSAEKDESRDPHTLEPPATERLHLCAAMSGTTQGDWRARPREFDFFDLKGAVQGLLERMGFTRLVVESVTDDRLLHPGRAACFLKSGQQLCRFGELHPRVAKEMDIRKRVLLLEMPLEGAILELSETPRYREIPRTPPVKRDIALIVDKQISALEIERTIRSAGGDLLSGLRLFDLYEGKNIPEGHRSLAFSMTYRDPNPDVTLTDEKVNALLDATIKSLQKKHGATLRS